MSKEKKADNKPSATDGSVALPPQSSQFDTTNWDDRPFYTVPADEQSVTVRPPKSKEPREVVFNGPAPDKDAVPRITDRKRERALIMSPEDDAWVKRNRKRLQATNPEWLASYLANKGNNGDLSTNQKNAEPGSTESK